MGRSLPRTHITFVSFRYSNIYCITNPNFLYGLVGLGLHERPRFHALERDFSDSGTLLEFPFAKTPAVCTW